MVTIAYLFRVSILTFFVYDFDSTPDNSLQLKLLFNISILKTIFSFSILSFIPFTTMRDLKTLRELTASVTDWESRKKIPCKPFWSKFLDLIISLHAPELYSKEELDQTSYSCKLLSGVESKS